MAYEDIIESLSPIERTILPLLNEHNFDRLVERSGMERVSVLRALEFLGSKKVIKLEIKKEKIVNLGSNGEVYRKKGLPERQLLKYIVNSKGRVSLSEAGKKSGLNDQEFKVSLGTLKKKALIDLKNGDIILSAKKEEIGKKTLEEVFLEKLPLNFNSLKPEELFAFNSLKDRKDVIRVEENQLVSYSLSDIGKSISGKNINLNNGDMIEQLTPELIKSGRWEGKKFRKYDVVSPLPKINGGKRHFVNQSIDYGRRVWTELGFKEMKGDLVQESFWNFDALFTAQDHPVRDLQDTFFLPLDRDVKDKSVVKNVKQAHEKGVDGSKGWGGVWNENEAKKLVLRTHTTCLSARTLYELSKLPIERRRGKFFAIGKCFRNETVDWKHGFEFNQTEGIVIDPDANFQNLLGYLKEFFKKMGFPKIRFRPHYFPYTEPSVEIDAWHTERKEWIELGGAGIFRPEVTVPLLGENIPVLAWGPGFDRILMDYYKIKDLRELYGNDIKQIRSMKVWKK